MEKQKEEQRGFTERQKDGIINVVAYTFGRCCHHHL